jgi:predicted nuclease of predicted toxin-antitoxin system
MRFLIDADLPRSLAKIIQSRGHEAIDVRDIGLGDSDDATIAAKAKADRFCLMSGDFGFADIRNYHPEEYAGIIVLELPKDATAPTILAIVDRLLQRDDVLQKLSGRLAVVSAARIRLRPT